MKKFRDDKRDDDIGKEHSFNPILRTKWELPHTHFLTHQHQHRRIHNDWLHLANKMKDRDSEEDASEHQSASWFKEEDEEGETNQN